MAKKPKTGLQRGGAGYAINFFRSDILVNLQLDLKRLERDGMDEDVCMKVQTLLSALVSAASAEPRGSFWGAAVHRVVRGYERVYIEWNNVKGSDHQCALERNRLLCLLQDSRHQIANACRKNSYALSEEHDLQIVTAINDALKDTIKMMPGAFTALAKSAERFAQRAILSS